jgi:formamidopyrimidine-DNA glycosylase
MGRMGPTLVCLTKAGVHMPELPDITIYLEALRSRILGDPLEAFRFSNPFVVRTFDPPVAALVGRRVGEIRRMGKRIVFCFDDSYFLVLHLMIAGRLRWKKRGAGLPGKVGLCAFDYPKGSLILSEAGTRRRASLHVVRGESDLATFDPGGLEVLECDFPAFETVLRSRTHTLKRALTDPHLFSGIGNAYSDEILHAARLSPMRLTTQVSQEEGERLYVVIREVLVSWTKRLREETAGDFPEKVTAFREGMAAHGRYRQPCPRCGTKIQRIAYADNETNYCPTCQTGGRLLADRALSRLLRSDWPRSFEELEAHMQSRKK